MNILYIEDNEHVAPFVCILLKGHGYEVEHFTLGKAGLERFHQAVQTWDAVIIDLGLPDGAGEALIPEIIAQRPTLPIIVYSGMSGLKECYELYSSGASALLSKPTSGQDLLDILKELIQMPPTPVS